MTNRQLAQSAMSNLCETIEKRERICSGRKIQRKYRQIGFYRVCAKKEWQKS